MVVRIRRRLRRLPRALPALPRVLHHSLGIAHAHSALRDPVGQQDLLIGGEREQRARVPHVERPVEQGRAVCPSCNTRRMVATAAHLIDHVLPPLPLWEAATAAAARNDPAWDHTPPPAPDLDFDQRITG